MLWRNLLFWASEPEIVGGDSDVAGARAIYDWILELVPEEPDVPPDW